MPDKTVIIIGAGLAGSLLAIYLAKRGIAVDVYEARGDMRKEATAAGRSINLALSDRGIAALRAVGMDEYMLAEAVPMYGRMIHSVSGGTKLLPYSGRQGEYINSVSRGGLNIALINEAEKYAGVQFHFNESCIDFDCESGEAIFENGRRVKGETVIATDGAGSAVRRAMERQMPYFETSSVFLEHRYKELAIPPPDERNPVAAARGSDLELNALHIWPRHRFMMIALPNFDGSFTCTLFLAHKGFEDISRGSTQIDADQNTFNDLRHLRESAANPKGKNSLKGTSRGSTQTNSDENNSENLRESAAKPVLDFFEREFPDAVPLMPTLIDDFLANPTGDLGTVKCWPWHVGGKALLLGDSAHAMVPFFGQGMNCAFEDVRVLDELLSEQGAAANGPRIDWEAVFQKFSALRRPNTDAIQDMAEENFYEMRDRVADPVFQRKRELETRLEQTYADYFSKYSMVTFCEDLPYLAAKTNGNAQDRLLMKICAAVESIDEIDLRSVIDKVRGL